MHRRRLGVQLWYRPRSMSQSAVPDNPIWSSEMPGLPRWSTPQNTRIRAQVYGEAADRMWSRLACGVPTHRTLSHSVQHPCPAVKVSRTTVARSPSHGELCDRGSERVGCANIFLCESFRECPATWFLADRYSLLENHGRIVHRSSVSTRGPGCCVFADTLAGSQRCLENLRTNVIGSLTR